MLPADQKKVPQTPKPADSHDHPSNGHATAFEFASAAAPPPGLSAAPNLGTLLHALRKSWKLAFPVALLGAVIAGAVTWLLVPGQYTSAMIFRIQSRPAQSSLEDESNFQAVQKSKIALMKSHEVLAETIEKSRVAELYGVTVSPSQLQKKMTANFVEGPEMLTVSLSNPNPQAAAALLNALGEVFPGKTNRTEEQRIKEQIKQLEHRLSVDQNRTEVGQVATLAEQLRDKRIELRRAEKDAKLDDAHEHQAKLNALRFELTEAKRNVSARRTAIEGAKSDLELRTERLNKIPAPVVSDAEAEESLRNDPDYQELMRNVAKIQKEMDDIRSITVESKWNKLLADPRSKLRTLNRSRLEMLDASRAKLAARAKKAAYDKLSDEVEDLKEKLDRFKTEEKSLRAEMTRLEKKVDEFETGGPKPPAHVLTLRDQVGQLENEYKRVGEQLAALKGSLPVPPRVVLYSEAFVPTEKDLNRPLKFSLASAGGVFFCLVVGFCLLEARGRRVYASSEVSDSLGLPVIGVIPRLSALRRSHTTGQTPGGPDVQFGLTEAVDSIRTVLLHSPRVDGARVVMVASASEGEGKTTLASHLAASLARSWRKTLLIDGDLRNPNQHLQFEQPLEPGLSEALRGEVEFEDAIRPTQVSRLWLLSAGKLDAHALQALAQDGIGSVFDWLKEHYDFIVIDSSPVLPVPDALMLGKHADAVLLSVMKDVSRMPAVYQAQQRFESLRIRVLGAVVIGEKTEKYGHAVPYGQSGT